MSNTVVRRNSSKQGLQNLMRLMAQRSIEDAEELERERRQRAREASRMNGCSTAAEFSAENETQAEENRSDWKPNNSSTLEEDEGFGDWTQRKKQQMQELKQGGDHAGEKVITRATGSVLASSTSKHLQRPEQREHTWSQAETARRSEAEEELNLAQSLRREEAMTPRVEEEVQRSDPEKRTEAKLSSKVFLRQEETQRSPDSRDTRPHMKTAKATSNNLTKTPTKMDDKMEQPACAAENSQEVRSEKTALRDLSGSAEVVASRKSLFEVGDARNQNSSKVVTCKDTNGLKVGVAELISQWVKGQSEDSSRPPCRVTDVKPGDVMQKKNLWEEIRDSSKQMSKASAASKKYKFVVTGHGKYQKMAVEEGATQSD